MVSITVSFFGLAIDESNDNSLANPDRLTRNRAGNVTISPDVAIRIYFSTENLPRDPFDLLLKTRYLVIEPPFKRYNAYKFYNDFFKLFLLLRFENLSFSQCPSLIVL